MKLQLSSQDAAGWVPPMGLVLLLWIAVSWRLRLYRTPHESRPWAVLAWAGENTLAICSLTVVSTFFSRQFGEGASRMFVLCMLPVTFVILALTRSLAMTVVAAAQHRWQPPRIALIGDATSARQLLSRIESQIGSAIRGVIVPEAAAAATVGHFMPVLGTTGQIAELVNRERIERVIVLNSSLSDAEVERCNRVFRRMGLPVSCTVDLPTERAAPAFAWRGQDQLRMFSLYGLPLVESQSRNVPLVQDFVKRVFDLGLAVVAAVLLAPAMLAIAVLIKLTSPGPALEKASRVGKGGRYFTCLKFRTNYVEGDAAPLETPKRTTPGRGVDYDEHITLLGKFLRRYSLDELPQLVNILRGEMSFVGPRPLPAHNLGPDGMSREFFAWSETRARVHPGLTGLWQVSGRNTLSFEDMIRLDLEYIQKRSLSLDLSILLETPIPVLRGTGAS